MARIGWAERRGGLYSGRLFIWGLLFLGLVWLMGCRAAPPTPVTLRIGILGVLTELPYFVMREREFDRRYGITFEESLHRSGPEIMQRLADGQLDVGTSVGTVPALAAAARGLVPGKVIVGAAESFSDPQHPAFAVLAGATITDWNRLEGQAIAVNAAGTLGAGAIRARLAQEGVRDYRLVEIAFANMGLAVAGGNVAAAVVPEPWFTQSLLRGDGRLLGWVIGGPPLERVELTVVTFSAHAYRQRPDAVKAYLRAHLASLAWINSHADAIRPILTRRLALSEEVGRRMHLLEWRADGRSDRGLLERLQVAMRDNGMLDRTIPAERLLDETLLDQVLAERR